MSNTNPSNKEDCFAAGCGLMLVFESKPKRKMLFLDDRTRRIHSALRQFSPRFDVTIVTNVKECLRYLSREDYDEVSLDHDLKGVDFEDPDSPECGMEVVRYLEKTGWPANKSKPIFRIHSSNLFAAYLMITRLHNLGMMAFYEPFRYAEDECTLKFEKERARK